jgi:23S rRNA (uridine2552-2'-O)-methyltransferase
MARRDQYFNKSKQEGYRARSAYKLQQLDASADLFGDGMRVLDLGAAPGGWLQVAAERVGSGLVIGVDRQRIRPFEEGEAGFEATNGATRIETIRGDITDERTREAIRTQVAEAGHDSNRAEGEIDLVLSDMSPNMSGTYDLDHARSVHLARQAFEVGNAVLAPGGDLAVKVFDGSDLDALQTEIGAEFEYVRTIRPDASRDSSSELYLVAKGRLSTPIRAGDELTVTITERGREGDGIAKIEGYTVFVPDTEIGEQYRIEIEEVKSNFGFASVIEG